MDYNIWKSSPDFESSQTYWYCIEYYFFVLKQLKCLLMSWHDDGFSNENNKKNKQNANL